MKLEELKKILTELDDIQAEADKRLERLNKRIAELKEQDDEKPEPPHPRPYPERHQMYFYVNSMGNVNETNWLSDHTDLGAHEIGNVFFGETEAMFFAERLKVLTEMREWAGNWDDKYAILYDYGGDIMLTSFKRTARTHGEMRFATEEDAENCIKAVGEDRIKKYYFMIPEDETNE